MTLFSEIYNCYFQIIKSILEKRQITEKALYSQIKKQGYEESVIFLLPKLINGEWELFKKNGKLYVSKLSRQFYVPLTTLQKSFLKAILLDDKIKLFLDQDQIKKLSTLLNEIPPLWTPDDFYYYDQFSGEIDYTNPEYIAHFRTILTALNSYSL